MAPQKMPGGNADKSAFFRSVEQWLRDNPGKDLQDWRKETGYTGPPLKKRGGVRVSYKGKSAAADVVRNTNEAIQRVGKDVFRENKIPGLDLHHKRAIAVYQPFFEGLNNKEIKELAQWFVDEGYALGNVKSNLEAATKSQHNDIHQWMRDNFIQPEGKPLLNFKGIPLNARLPRIVQYLENVQPAVDEQLRSIKATARGNLNIGGYLPVPIPSGSQLKQLISGAKGQLPFNVGAAIEPLQKGQPTEAVKKVAEGTAIGMAMDPVVSPIMGRLIPAIGAAVKAAPVAAPAAAAVATELAAPRAAQGGLERVTVNGTPYWLDRKANKVYTNEGRPTNFGVDTKGGKPQLVQRGQGAGSRKAEAEPLRQAAKGNLMPLVNMLNPMSQLLRFSDSAIKTIRDQV